MKENKDLMEAGTIQYLREHTEAINKQTKAMNLRTLVFGVPTVILTVVFLYILWKMKEYNYFGQYLKWRYGRWNIR